MRRFLDFCYRYSKSAAVIAGVVSVLAMSPTAWWPILFATLSLLLMLLQKAADPKTGAIYLFLFGMGYFTAGLYWIGNALAIAPSFAWAIPFAVIGLPFLLSMFWAVCGYIVVRFSTPDSLGRVVLFLTLFALTEYTRAFFLSGFPWNLFGYTWVNLLPVTQATAIGGIYFLSALTLFWAVLPALAWIARGYKNIQRSLIAVAVGSFIAAYAYGAQRLEQHPTQLRDDVIAAIIQPNIKQEEKWDADKAVEHFNLHIDLSNQALNEIKPTPSIKSVAIIWPETALDDALLVEKPQTANALIRLLKPRDYQVTFISGFFRTGPSPDKPRYYNSLAVISAENSKLVLEDAYDKHHLVPFGEYLPFEDTLALTPVVGFAGFAAGSGPRVLTPRYLPPFSGLICYEAIFPAYSNVPNAEWIVNTSNDGWYGNTPGPYQHLAMTRFRAVEQGIPIVRSATTGVSAIIDGYGRIISQLGYDRSGSLIGYLPEKPATRTFYSQYGETWFFLYLILGTFLFVISRHKRI